MVRGDCNSIDLISIIVPCYNQAHHLTGALTSILAQTHTRWEAIVVDDGSTDNTREVTAQFNDPRVWYIYQENQGLSSARNTGIGKAQGEYLAFLDADDEWEPGFLNACVAELQCNPALAGVYTRMFFIDPEGRKLPVIGGQALPPGQVREKLLQDGFFPPCSVVVRATVLQKIGVFDTKLTSLEDTDLWIRLTQHHALLGLDAPLVRYRVYPGSMSTNAPRMFANRMAVMTKHFGLPEGNPSLWTEEKRRVYGFAYRASARLFLEQGQPDEAWRLLAQAVNLWPDLLNRLDTFYELVCGDQPKGYRGQAELLDIEGNGAEMLQRMETLFAVTGTSARNLKEVAYGNAYLALAMLSDQAGHWCPARRYIGQALRANPRLLRQSDVVRRLLKLCAGKRLIGWLRRLVPARESES